MSEAQTMAKIAALPEILKAAQLLEGYGLLQKDEKASDIVKRYVMENPDINGALNSTGSGGWDDR